MRGFFPDNVSDYTKEQCEEYLQDHPNGLRADYVRERLKLFAQPPSKGTDVGEEEYWKHNHSSIAELKSYKNKYPQGKHLAECNALLKSKESGMDTASSFSDSTTNTIHSSVGWELFGKIILSIGAVVLVIFAACKWHLIGTAIAGAIGQKVLREIWREG